MATKELWIKKLTMGRDHVLRLAVLVSVLIPVWFMVAALGTKFGLLNWKIGLGVMTFSLGPAFVLMALVIALFAAYAVLVTRPWGGGLMLAIALIIPLGGFLGLGAVRANATKLPPIHDISTDPTKALTISDSVIVARGPDSNPIVAPATTVLPADQRFKDWAGITIAAAQAKGYPSLKPLTLPIAPSAAFEKAEKAALAQGLAISMKDAATGRIEATASTFWFGFKDDVVIQVSAEGTGSRVDVRSVSRVGLSDLGANAKRIGSLLAAIKA